MFQANLLLWLCSICVGDFFIIAFEGVWILLKVWFRFDIRDLNDGICVFHKAASNYFLYWSAYMQCALSVQRAYFVFRPLRPRPRGWVSWQHMLIWMCITLFLLLPMIPYPMYWRVINDDCDPLDTNAFYVTTLNDLIIWGIIPLLGMTISTAVICWNMTQAARNLSYQPSIRTVKAWVDAERSDGKVRRMTQTSVTNTSSCAILSTKIRRNTLSSITFTPKAQQQLQNPNAYSRPSTVTDNYSSFKGRLEQPYPLGTVRDLNRSSSVELSNFGSTPHVHASSVRHNASDNTGQVTRLLVCMNICYLASTFPLLIFLMFRNFSSVHVPPDIHRFAYYLCRSFCFINSCTNWIFYCLVGKRFRQQAKRIILICLKASRFRSEDTTEVQRIKNSLIHQEKTILQDENCEFTQPTQHSQEAKDEGSRSTVHDMKQIVIGIPKR
ncbi:unnamed protein product [Schistocephalus solidus]|nr:unnamed protein product [Schistocephalus solidus]